MGFVCNLQTASPLALLNSVAIVATKIVNEFLFEVLHGLEFLQIKQFTFRHAEKVLSCRIVKKVPFAAHTLPHALYLEHPLVLIMPGIVCSGRNR